jgi:glycosyltransferase involved in cell wall biosynthesis
MMPNSLISTASFVPNSLQFPSSWLGHLPFAAWVIQEVSPKIFVELGTHSGNSYFSFCQSVAMAGIPTKCYAVDTWQGDEHAGQYNDEIFAKVNEHHQEQYAEFSRLLRMAFDDAVTYFADESIELLHIDGLHTYEAVRHDFETWLPKLAPGAVVMFHDINVRERNFGVWKLWEELQARYPNNLEFVHSHGLGVLQLNNAPDRKELGWLQPNSPEKQRLINYFASLGSWQLQRFELNELKQQAASLNQAVHDKEIHISNLTQMLDERDGQIAHLNQAVHDKEIHISNLTQMLVEREGQIAHLNQAAHGNESHIANLTQKVGERDEKISNLNQVMAERDSVISQILASSSWRATRPFRAIKARFSSSRGTKNLLENTPKRFDAVWYLKRNPDVAMSGMSAYTHYLQFGKSEGRQPVPDAFFVRNVKRARLLHGATLVAIKRNGSVWRAISKAWGVLNREGWEGVRRCVILYHSQATNSVDFDRNDYAEWVRRYDTLTVETRTAMQGRIDALGYKPLISVVMPVYNPPLNLLEDAIRSVQGQLYSNWELCIADDASTDTAVHTLLQRYAYMDSRIKVVFRKRNGHISAASNSALDLVKGEFVALLDNDDLLREHALFWVADAIVTNPDAGLIYSDEDKIDQTGRRYDPYFKPDWNPDLFLSHNMICHLGVYSTDLIRQLGGFREGYEGAQDYDLALRFTEQLSNHQIVHIPRVLYHWRSHPGSTAQAGSEKNYALLAGERALNDHFARTKITAKAELQDYGMYRTRYHIPAPAPLVSLIIPTRNGLDLIKQCVDSIFSKTTYKNYEIIVVDNNSDDPNALAYFASLHEDTRIRIIRDERPFNYSALNNAAVNNARGEYVGLINNDIEVISPEWLEEMMGLAIKPDVGVVGARLWYPNDMLQHGGCITGIGGVAGHSHKHLPRGQFGYFARAQLIQTLSVVTAACLVVKKSIYQEVGGLDETNLKVAFNDVDFCLRVREAGYRNVWTPYAELYHHESATRGSDDTPEKQLRFSDEVLYMKSRWGDALINDPAYNPNLTLDYEDFSYAWPPRVEPILRIP